MIESIVLQYLQTALGMQEVYLEVPSELPELFVVFGVSDRGKSNCVNAVTLEIHSHAQSKYEAAVLDELVRTAMENIIDLDSISSSKLGGGNDKFDDSTGTYMYRCYYNLFY